MFTTQQQHILRLASYNDLHTYNRYMYMCMNRVKWLDNFHHRIVCDALMDVFHGRRKNLLINIPPRYSKTELAIVAFASWALGRVPDCEFIHCSSTADLASENSSKVKRVVTFPEYRHIFPRTRLKRGSNAADHWKTTENGVFYAKGAEGQITGFGAGKKRADFGGAILADDLHKALEVRHEKARKDVINFFVEVLLSRRNDPRTPMIVIGQRLNEDDIANFLLNNGTGEHFDLICLPAIQADGSALWPAMHTLERLQMMSLATPYMFSGQYQQQPSPLQGNIFKPYNMPVIDALPINIEWVRAWDFAGTEDDGDYTVGALIGKAKNNAIIIGDIVRLQGSPDVVLNTLKNTAARDGLHVKIKIPQDPGQAGKAQAQAYTRQLPEYHVISEPVTGDKLHRATPLAAQVNVGNVSMVKGPWNQDVINEMRMFPNGKHDDIIDAAADGYNTLFQTSTGLLDYYSTLFEQLDPAEKARMQPPITPQGF